MLSANSYSLEESKICRLGKGKYVICKYVKGMYCTLLMGNSYLRITVFYNLTYD